MANSSQTQSDCKSQQRWIRDLNKDELMQDAKFTMTKWQCWEGFYDMNSAS